MQLTNLARAGIPWSTAIGLELLSMGDGVGRVAMPWRDDLAAFAGSGSVATGAIAALIDHCCGMAVLSILDRPAGISTLNLKIDHLGPSDARHAITAEARCYHRTTMTAFVRAEAWDRDSTSPIAAAQAAFAINRPVEG